MRDRYVGDIGDFAKYGLLRAIGKGKRLGVAWYLCVDSDAPKSGDGRHIAYLQRPDEWRHLDHDLFDRLKILIDEQRRSVKEIEKSGILGNAKFADEPVDATQIAVRERKCWRRAWFERVQNALSDCDVVFADPDNGLYPDEKFNPERKDHAKRIPLSEVLALAEDRTTVIYHHNSRRRGGHIREIKAWMSRMPGRSYAWYWRRQSNRTFFVLNPNSEVEHLLEDFAERWSACGTLYCSESKPRPSDHSGTESMSVRKGTRIEEGSKPTTPDLDSTQDIVSAQTENPKPAIILPRRAMQERILERLMRQFDQPVMNNVHRGNFVECMIACALGDDWQLTWEAGWDWAAWDCEHIATAAKLEIKQAAARQSWDRDGVTRRRKPSFDIAPRSGFWPKDGGPWVPSAGRQADVYVFAWHGRHGKEADQRDPEQWQFFAIAESDLPAGQKSIGLARLKKIVSPCGIDGLRQAVSKIAAAQGVEQES